jgi:spore coat polysaccharide biosynthesis predicted glycosyltransferase SpsG
MQGKFWLRNCHLGSPRVQGHNQVSPAVSWCLVDEEFYKDEKKYIERKTRDQISLAI